VLSFGEDGTKLQAGGCREAWLEPVVGSSRQERVERSGRFE
jgi:hypothetical protein